MNIHVSLEIVNSFYCLYESQTWSLSSFLYFHFSKEKTPRHRVYSHYSPIAIFRHFPNKTSKQPQVSPLSNMQQNIRNRRFPYERLSKLYLTKKALQDFEKILPPSLSSYSFPPRPIAPERLPTLGDLGIDLCYHIESGGPDLSDLRGVRVLLVLY